MRNPSFFRIRIYPTEDLLYNKLGREVLKNSIL